MSRMKLGRMAYKVLRHKDGYYDDNGLYVEGGWDEITIRASYHGGLYWNAVKFNQAGEVSKQAISIRSDQPLYQSSVSDTSNGGKLGDVFVDEDGVHWEVRECRKYKNLRATRHWEAMAVRLDEDEIPRK